MADKVTSPVLVPVTEPVPVMVSTPEPVAIVLPLKVLAVTSPVPLILTPLAAPIERRAKGAVVPIPTLEFVVSKSISPEEMFKAVVEEGRVQVEAAAAERFSAPAEVKANAPDVTVERVRLPEVFVQEDVPPDSKANTPVELPMLVAAVPVVLIFPVPVTVNPPVPCNSPAPELTPTAVTAPLELTWNCEVEPTENKDEGLVVPIPT